MQEVIQGLSDGLAAIKSAIENASEGIPSMEGKHLGDALVINQEEDFEPSGYGWETVNFVPTPLLASTGQVLTVKEVNNEKTYGWENAPSELPTYGVSEGGKALKVNSAGTGLEWGNAGGGEVYSSSEAVVGTWTDGRPVYQKVYTATVGGNTSTGIQHGLYGIADQIVNVDGIAYIAPGTFYKLGDLRTIDNGQVTNAIGISEVMLQDLGSIGIFSGKTYNGLSINFMVYLRYTKSADL